MVSKGFCHTKSISGTILLIVGIVESLGEGQGQIEFKRDR